MKVHEASAPGVWPYSAGYLRVPDTADTSPAAAMIAGQPDRHGAWVFR